MVWRSSDDEVVERLVAERGCLELFRVQGRGLYFANVEYDGSIHRGQDTAGSGL